MKEYTIEELAYEYLYWNEVEDHALSFIEVLEHTLSKLSTPEEKGRYLKNLTKLIDRRILHDQSIFSDEEISWGEIQHKKDVISFVWKDYPSMAFDDTPEKRKARTYRFKNNFDNVEENEVYKYFHKELVKTEMLSNSDFEEYLTLAFESKVIPKKLFRLKNKPIDRKVIRVFYFYYKNLASKPHGKQKKYAALLGDYFESYSTSNISSNFSK